MNLLVGLKIRFQSTFFNKPRKKITPISSTKQWIYTIVFREKGYNEIAGQFTITDFTPQHKLSDIKFMNTVY